MSIRPALDSFKGIINRFSPIFQAQLTIAPEISVSDESSSRETLETTGSDELRYISPDMARLKPTMLELSTPSSIQSITQARLKPSSTEYISNPKPCMTSQPSEVLNTKPSSSIAFRARHIAIRAARTTGLLHAPILLTDLYATGPLCRGAYGHVTTALAMPGTPLAMRDLGHLAVTRIDYGKLPSIGRKQLQNCVFSHERVSLHPYIASFYGSFRHGSDVYIVSEPCTMYRLDEFVVTNRLPINLSLQFIVQISSALRYMHARGVAHCDVRPGNIGLSGVPDSAKVKVIFYGFDSAFLFDSSIVEGLKRKEKHGSMRYMPPEIAYASHCPKKLDVFAFGMTAFEMICREGPWDERDMDVPNRNLYQKIVQAAKFDAEKWDEVPKGVISTLESCLRLHPGDRPSIELVEKKLRRIVHGNVKLK